MKLTYFVPVVTFAIAGCSSQVANSVPQNAAVGMNSQQVIDKLQNNSKIPEGLRQIQINTLRHDPMAQPDSSAVNSAPKVASVAQREIDKIQGDSKMPDGLKQIQIDTLRHEPMAQH